jgi:hypothetical protein
MNLIKRLEFEEIRPNIFVQAENINSSFNKEVKVLFAQIESNPIGRRLLEKIYRYSSEIHVLYGKECQCISNHEIDSSTIISPVIVRISMRDLVCFSITGESIPLPMHVILFHKLIHAYHHLSGKFATSQLCDPLVWESDEEYKTIIGFPHKKEKSTPKITENAFRKEEGLPDRFGSWSPSGNGVRSALCAARIKTLGAIHTRNQLAYSDKLIPPLALCSVSDLGLESRCVVLLAIQGVDVDFTPKNITSSFFWVDRNNSLHSQMGHDCYLRPPHQTDSDELKSLAKGCFSKLNNVVFKIQTWTTLRLSQQEFDILLTKIHLVKD